MQKDHLHPVHRLVTDQEENIKFLIENAPFKLDITDSIVQEIGLYYLPYSTGIEIECYIDKEADFTQVLNAFNSIPFIMDYHVHQGMEQRFRIPNGIQGILSLFHISENMKKFAYLNPSSGIHYHIDCTDSYNEFNDEFIAKQADYILSELDSWNYQGSYNFRRCNFTMNHNWIRFQKEFKTAEIRIGEMTFDYSLLLQRIKHANDIMRNVKSNLVPLIQRYSKDSKEIINNRIIKI